MGQLRSRIIILLIVTGVMTACGGGGTTSDKSVNADPEPIPAIIYYQNDHLGSAHLITDSAGRVVHEEGRYPYGMKRQIQIKIEVEENSQPQAVVEYVYTGKEYDVETGLIYFGGRYYAPAIGQWLTPDPLFLEKTPQESIDRPRELNLYAYVRNNPMTFVDPHGYKLKFEKGVSDDFKQQYAKALEYLKEGGVAGPILELDARKETVWLREIDNHENQFAVYGKRGALIEWNPRSGLDVRKWPERQAYDRGADGSYVQTPALGLLHEAAHALGYVKGELKPRTDVTNDVYHYAEEKRVIIGYEQPAAKKLGESTRYYYGGDSVNVSCATCRN